MEIATYFCWSSALSRWISTFWRLKNRNSPRPPWKFSPQLLISIIHPRKLTWHPKIDTCKRRFLLETIILRFHVSFRECTYYCERTSLGSIHDFFFSSQCFNDSKLEVVIRSSDIQIIEYPKQLIPWKQLSPSGETDVTVKIPKKRMCPKIGEFYPQNGWWK